MAYILTEDGKGRQVRVPVFNESEDGTGTWHVPVCDSSGYLKVALADGSIGSGKVYINETANAKMDIGLTINQGTNTDEIFAAKASDVDHGATVHAETDTYFMIKKGQTTYGGVGLWSFKESGGVTPAFSVISLLDTNADTTRSTSGRSLIELIGGKISGTDTAAVGADSNILGIRKGSGVGGASTTVAIFDEDGDLWLNGVITSLATYSQDVGATTRDLLVDSTGLIGYQASSLKYKEDVQPIGELSRGVYDLEPISFKWKKGGEGYGISAEQAYDVLPQIVSLNKNGEPETVSYTRLVPFLLNEVQGLKRELDKLRRN